MIASDRTLPAKSGPVRRAAPPAWFELRRDIPSWIYKALAAVSFATVLAVWIWLSHQDFINPIFLPTPERVWDSVQSLLSDHYLWSDIRISLLRVTGELENWLGISK